MVTEILLAFAINREFLNFVQPVFNRFTCLFLHSFFLIVYEAQFDGWIFFEIGSFHNTLI